MQTIFNIYKEYSDISYACYSQVRVISKTRIFKSINEYDIIGTTICSNEVLSKIDREIIKFYTGIDIIKFEKFLNEQ